MPKIATQYIVDLLNSPKPVEAVYDLASLWCMREGRSESLPYFGFTVPEFHAHMFLLYSGDVANGGHVQFFLNPVGAYAADVRTALSAMGLASLATIFTRACAVFPDGRVPIDTADRRRMLAAMSEEQLAVLSAADREYDSVDSAAFAQVLAYLRSNADQVLPIERA